MEDYKPTISKYLHALLISLIGAVLSALSAVIDHFHGHTLYVLFALVCFCFFTGIALYMYLVLRQILQQMPPVTDPEPEPF